MRRDTGKYPNRGCDNIPCITQLTTVHHSWIIITPSTTRGMDSPATPMDFSPLHSLAHYNESCYRCASAWRPTCRWEERPPPRRSPGRTAATSWRSCPGASRARWTRAPAPSWRRTSRGGAPPWTPRRRSPSSARARSSPRPLRVLLRRAPFSPSRAGRAPSHPQVWHECTTPAAGPAHRYAGLIWRRLRCLRRSPVELSVCVESLLPLHSATAAARMIEILEDFSSMKKFYEGLWKV